MASLNSIRKAEEQVNDYLKAKNLNLLNFDPDPKSSESPRAIGYFVNGRVVDRDQALRTFTTKVVRPCEAEGTEVACSSIICMAHILTQQYKPLAANKNNKIFICKAHETHFNKKGNEYWYEYVKKFHPEKFDWVRSRCKQIIREAELILEVFET